MNVATLVINGKLVFLDEIQDDKLDWISSHEFDAELADEVDLMGPQSAREWWEKYCVHHSLEYGCPISAYFDDERLHQLRA